MSAPMSAQCRLQCRLNVDSMLTEKVVEIRWELVRLAWFLDQNLGLGVIYGTVPSEFDYRNQFTPKIDKTSAQIASKKYVLNFSCFSFWSWILLFGVLIYWFLFFGFWDAIFYVEFCVTTATTATTTTTITSLVSPLGIVCGGDRVHRGGYMTLPSPK